MFELSLNRQCSQDEAAEGEEKELQEDVHVSARRWSIRQYLNSGVLSGGRQNPPAKSFLDINADLVPLGILDGGRRVTHPPAPPGGESKDVSPLTD